MLFSDELITASMVYADYDYYCKSEQPGATDINSDWPFVN